MAKLPDMARPRTGVTPVRNLRVSDDVWERALAIARRNGETITAVIVRALEAYIAKHDDTADGGDN